MAPKKKASTKYSPAPMSDAAKRKASRAGEAKAYQYVDIMKRPEKKGPARTSYSPQRMTEYDKRKAGAAGKATNDKYNDLVSKLTRNYRVTAKEASSMIKFIGDTAGGFKQGLQGVDFTKEIPKYVGGAVKANLQLPGTVAKMIKRNTKQTVNEFKKGFNKK